MSATATAQIMRPCALAVLTALAALSCKSSGGAKRVSDGSVTQPDAQAVVAWVLPYEDSLSSLAQNEWITVASPTYFRLAVEGKSARLEDWDPAVPFPRSRLPRGRASLEVIPLVGCIGPCGPKISRILDDEIARTRHVADLLRVSAEQGLAGLFIDYEDVDATEAGVTQFVEELSSGLHAAGKKLALVVQEPCGIDPSCRRSPYPFALRTILPKIDLLAVMEYDHTVDGSAAPAPREWVQRGLTKVVAEVGDARQLRKVVCAVPYYGRLTSGIADDTAVLFKDVHPGRIRNTQVTLGNLTFDPGALSKVATVASNAKTGTLYFEDHETLAARLAHLSGFKLGGVAIWRLGGEDPCNAAELARFRQLRAPPCPH